MDIRNAKAKPVDPYPYDIIIDEVNNKTTEYNIFIIKCAHIYPRLVNKTQDTLLATTFMEIVTYFTFIANEMLYLDCEK